MAKVEGISSKACNINIPKIWKKYEDGYLVRCMTPDDAKIVQNWHLGLDEIISEEELNICLDVFPSFSGFYIGEKDGEVVASAIRLPWGDSVFFGSYYYVAEHCRRLGYGTRLRDEVAREYVGDNTLVIDAVLTIAERNKKFGYIPTFVTTRYSAIAKGDYGIQDPGTIVKTEKHMFNDIMEYDNKHFISKNNPMRRGFMERWLYLENSASYVCINNHGAVVGLCCRRKSLTPDDHQIGPLYADSPKIAEALLQRSCQDIVTKNVNIYCWSLNKAASEIVKKFEFKKEFDLQRMYLNEDPKEYKDTVYSVTSIDVCGF